MLYSSCNSFATSHSLVPAAGKYNRCGDRPEQSSTDLPPIRRLAASDRLASSLNLFARSANSADRLLATTQALDIQGRL